MIKKRTSILRKALDMSLNSPPASPKRKLIPIWEAAVKGDVKTINSLLSQGVSVNQRDPLTDHTPLIAAVADLENPNQAPNTTILELLINRGAEINAFDQKTKQTILHHLCLRPNPSPAVLKFLLDRGANPNAVSSARHTPLHYLAERAKSSPLEPMRLLLDSGAEVDAKGPVMWTALHLLSSSEKPYLDAMMLLLTRDVDVNAKDSNRWTALHFVAHYNQDPAPALKILVDAGADVNALTKRHEGVIQVLLKSKSIDRLAALDLSQVSAASPTPSPVTATSGLGISGALGHARKRSTASNFSNTGSLGASSLPRISSVAEVADLASEQAEMANGGNVLLSPEDEAKEEALKKLADLIRWLMVDCGVHLEPSLDFEDKYPPSHPKNQHVLFRAIRLGMRPIVQVLLETSLAMSETHVLDEALQVTDDMLTALNMSVQPQQQHNGSENGSSRMSLESTASSTFRHRRNSSVSSNGSTLLSTNMSFMGGGGVGNSATAASNTIVTPKSIAQAAASIRRTQEIEVLLKVWRFGDQRQQLLDSVKSRLARSNRRRASKSGRGQLGQGQGQHNGGGSVGGGGSSVAGDDDVSVGCNSPVSSIHSEREREIFNIRSSTL
jgi:ankyrin repeat protein